MLKALEKLDDVTQLIKEIKSDIKEAIARTNDTPEDADSEELNECINDLNKMLTAILFKM